jgi:hypothetical protein
MIRPNQIHILPPKSGVLECNVHVLERKFNLAVDIALGHLEILRVPTAFTRKLDEWCTWDSDCFGVMHIAEHILGYPC